MSGKSIAARREARHRAEPADAVAWAPPPHMKNWSPASRQACRAAGGVEMPGLASGGAPLPETKQLVEMTLRLDQAGIHA